MSYTSLYKVFKTKRVELATFRNSYGSCVPVWDWLSQQYLNKDSWFGADRALWDLAEDQRVPVDVRLCHAFTFDYAVVRPEHFARMSAACVEMNRILETWPKWVGCVNHWGTMSEFFKSVKERHKITKRCLGVGMRGTSVSDVWDNYPRYGKDKVFDCVSHVLSGGEK
jgi:hypothetical protein